MQLPEFIGKGKTLIRRAVSFVYGWILLIATFLTNWITKGLTLLSPWIFRLIAFLTPKVKAVIALVTPKIVIIKAFISAKLRGTVFFVSQWMKKITSPPFTRKKIISLVLLGTAAIALFISANVALYRIGKWAGRQRKEVTALPTPTPSPTPYPFTVHGKIEYDITYTKPDGPKFTGAYIDPFDAKIGGIQTFGLSITSSKPITSASVQWQTDYKKKDVPMTLKTGTATKGTWEAVWSVDDTIWYNLYLVATASDGTTTNMYELSLR